MTSIERVMIKSALWILIPVLFFFIFWWASASLAIYEVYLLSEKQIALFSILGLIFGFVLVFLMRNRLFSMFYRVRLLPISLLYLVYSAICFAAMMGFPIGNFILGGIAGVYMGRRLKYNPDSSVDGITNVSLFTALVSAFWVLVLSVMALGDTQVLSFLESHTGLAGRMTQGFSALIWIAVISALAGLIQFYITRIMCRISNKF